MHRWRRQWSRLLVLLTILPAAITAHEKEADQQENSQLDLKPTHALLSLTTTKPALPLNDPRLLVLATADGRLLALDPMSGQLRWQIETNTPLIHAVHPTQNATCAKDSARRTAKARSGSDSFFQGSDENLWMSDRYQDVRGNGDGDDGDDDGFGGFGDTEKDDTEGDAHETKAVMLPGRDGALYAHWNNGLIQKLPMTSQQLVAMSPFRADDGTLFVGSKTSIWMTVDPDTGEVYDVFTSEQEHAFSLVGDKKDAPENLLLVGRSQYSVRMVSPTATEAGNLRYGKFTISPLKSRQRKIRNPTSSKVGLVQFVRGSKMFAIDSITGNVMWNTSIPSPAVSAFHIYPESDVHEISIHDTLSDFCEHADRCEMLDETVSAPPNLTIELTGKDESKPSSENSMVLIQQKESGSWSVIQSSTDNSNLFINAGQNHTYIHLETPMVLPDVRTHVLQWRILLPSDPSTKPDGSKMDENYGAVVYPPIIRVIPESPDDLESLQRPGTDVEKDADVISNIWKIFMALFTLLSAAMAAIGHFFVKMGKTADDSLTIEKASEEIADESIPMESGPSESPISAASNTSVDQSPKKPKKKKTKKTEKTSEKATGEHPSEGESTKQDLPENFLCRIGQLVVKNTIIGYGSHGTIVFEGEFYGRPVAVKRMLAEYIALADKEVSVLLKSEEHNSIVKYYAKETDTTFVYLALELCNGSLSDFIEPSEVSEVLKSIERPQLPFSLVENNMPTSQAQTLLHQLSVGLRHLHRINVIHRDLKPHNILLTKDWRPKISDMGFAKKIETTFNSSSQSFAGSAGWHSPEGLRKEKVGPPADIFQFGCIVFYVLTNGNHPFGKKIDRDHNIAKGALNLHQISHLPEAADLIASMLHRTPRLRPTAEEVLNHPFFWSAGKKLSFLLDASDRMEPEPANAPVILDLESMSNAVLGNNWMARLDEDFVENLGKYRKYNTSSLRDLLRVVRNKRNHFRDLPPELQAKVGPIPDGFLTYFQSRYPKLFVSVFHVIRRHFRNEPQFHNAFCGAEP